MMIVVLPSPSPSRPLGRLEGREARGGGAGLCSNGIITCYDIEAPYTRGYILSQPVAVQVSPMGATCLISH